MARIKSQDAEPSWKRFLEFFGLRGSDVVYVEGLTVNLYVEGALGVRRYREAIEHLRDAALPPRDSVDKIQPTLMSDQTRYG